MKHENNSFCLKPYSYLEIPHFDIRFWLGRTSNWCVIVPVLNEGIRLNELLNRMCSLKTNTLADIIIVDGGSTDGALEPKDLRAKKVRGLIVKKDLGKLSAQLRCGYAFALQQGYCGLITIDGNNKDDPEAIPLFINQLEAGFDFVQASRFIAGGLGDNTPKIRDLAIRWIHAPVLRWFSGFFWTDTTQGFRAYSSRLLCDSRVAPFRNVFNTYELLAYLSYRAPRLGYSCIEVPTIRRYPKSEPTPTKIKGIKGNLLLLMILIQACLGRFNPNE